MRPRSRRQPLLSTPLLIGLAATLLALLQIVDGSDAVFALLVMAFIALTCVTVQALGGLASFFGACVAVYALQHVIVSQVAKVFFWQPGDDTLYQPVDTMLVYNIGMLAMLLAAGVAKTLRITRIKPLFSVDMEPPQLLGMAIACFALALVRGVVIAVLGRHDASGGQNVGGILGPLRVVGFLGPLSIACGTAYTILTSRRRRTISLLVLLAMGSQIAFALLSADREEMITPIITYVITCYMFGVRLRVKHFAILGLAFGFAGYVLFPFALVARASIRTPNVGRDIAIGTQLLTEELTERDRFEKLEPKDTGEIHSRSELRYFHSKQMLLDRYSLILATDRIVNVTVVSGTEANRTIVPALQMLLPRILNSDKPPLLKNYLAHRVAGMAGTKDYTTGITIGFLADAFSAYGWVGAFVVPFVILLTFRLMYSFLIDNRLANNVLAISFTFATAWTFSEGVIAAQILLILQGPFIIGVTYYVLRTFTGLVANPLFSQTLVKLPSTMWRGVRAHHES